jgi:hypothetical protein
MSNDDPAAELWGFIQVRVYEHEHGALPEDDLRAQLRDYLSTEGLLSPAAGRRAV